MHNQDWQNWPSLNLSIVAGLMADEAKISATPDGNAWANFKVISLKPFKNKVIRINHFIKCYNQNVETVRYVPKGTIVFVVGESSSRKYTAKDGQEKWINEIFAHDVRILLKPDPNKAYENFEEDKPSTEKMGDDDFHDDDIPF